MIPFYHVRSTLLCTFYDHIPFSGFYTRGTSNYVTASSHRHGNTLFFSGGKSLVHLNMAGTVHHVQMDETLSPLFFSAPRRK